MVLGVVVVALTAVCLSLCWDMKEAGTLANTIAHHHGLGCLSIRYPPKQPWPTVFHFLKQLNVDPQTLRTFKVAPMNEPSNLKEWSGCSQVLSVLMAWLPSAQTAFPKFSEASLVDDPVWIVLLARDANPAEFFGDAFIPFQARVLAAVPIDGGVRLTEVWRVAEGFPLRSAAYALWKDSKLLCPRPVCKFHARKDLEGAPLKASTKDDMPIAALSRKKDGSWVITGYFGAVFHEIAEQINSTAVVVSSTDNMTGSEQNGTWNGLIGMMIRQETDLAVGPMSYDNKVLQVTGFLPPLLRTNYQVFFKQAGTVVEWNAFLKPFGKYIWRLILVWFIVGAIAYNYCYRTGCRLGLENPTYIHEFTKLNSFFTFLRAFCTQGSNLMPQSMACRGLHLTGYLTSSIILTAYSASLISKLTLQAPLRPFDTLETFLDDGSYTLTAIGRSTDYTYFSEATNQLLRDIYQKLMYKIPAEELPIGKEDGMLQVCHHHKRALFITFTVAQLTAKQLAGDYGCPILWFSSPLGTVFLTIGVRKNMPYTRLIASQSQVMVERGISKRLLKKEWPLERMEGRKLIPPELELKQVTQIHFILMVGILAATLILGLEMASVNPSAAPTLKVWIRNMGCSEDAAVTVVLSFMVVIILATVLANSLE